MRQVTRVAMKQSLRAARAGEHVTVVIEKAERIVAFESTWPPLLERSGRRDEELRDLGGSSRCVGLSL